MKLIQSAIVDAFMFCDGDSIGDNLSENEKESLKYKTLFEKFKVFDLKKVKNEEEWNILNRAFKYAELYMGSLIDCHGVDSEEGKLASKKLERYRKFRLKTFGGNILDDIDSGKIKSVSLEDIIKGK